MSLQIYKKNNLYYINGALVPVNMYRCVIQTIGGNVYITIENISQRTNVIDRILITDIQKETGYYTDIDEFKTDVGALFSSAPTGNITDYAKETTLSSVDSKLDTLNFKDFSTETTLLTVESDLSFIANTISNGDQLTQLYDVDSLNTLGITDNREAKVNDVNLTNGTQKTQIVDGDGDVASIKEVQTQVVGTDKGIVTNSIIHGTNDSGKKIPIPVTQEGHIEVAIHSPRLPFGSLHTENLTPIFQTDAVYGLNSGQLLPVQTTGSGTVLGDNNLFSCSTGTTIYSQAVLLGRKRLRYRAGQGVVTRFTAIYTTPVANSYQLVGVGTASDGIYVGYGNTNNLSDLRFGILYVRGGVREIKTLTVTTGATVASNCTITLNGTAFTVPLTAASNIQRTVYEISSYTGYTGWDAYPASSTTVVFIRKSAGTTASTQTFAAGTTGATATIVQTKAGVASVDTFIPQSDWNGDKLDGTGASGVTITPLKGNVFEIDLQYLGFGVIVIYAEVATANSNNAEFVAIHTIKNPNTLILPIFTNPSFPFTMAAYSAGSTTNLTVSCASFAGFIEGKKVLHGNRFTYFNQLTTVGSTNFQALFTIMNTRYYAGKANQSVINLLSVSGAIKHTSPVIYYLIRGGTLQGNPSFSQLSSLSCSVWDSSSTTVTYTNGEQLIWTGHLGDTGEIDHYFGNGEYNAEEVTLQPGEWMTLAVKATTGTPSYVTGSINTREDQ